MLWPDIELQMAILLSVFLKADTEATLSVYLKLRRSVPRLEALDIAAEIALDEKDLRLFRAIISVHRQLEGERNDLAHGYFGTSEEMPDALLWIDQQSYAKYSAQILNQPSPNVKIVTAEIESKIFVYKKKDLLDIYERCFAFCNILGFFINYLTCDWEDHSISTSTREEEYHRLCNEFPIREALLRQRARDLRTTSSIHPQKSRPSYPARVSNPPLRLKVRRS